jgi:hypothetical protein
MTPEALAMIAAYMMCSQAAEMRVLDPVEAEACSVIYMQVKLDFLSDVDMNTYQQMTAPERAEVSRRGYAALVAWRAANPDIVADLEAEAQHQLAEPGI